MSSFFPSFIRSYGTHIVVGVKMGGRDVVYVKQQHSSNLQPADVQRKLKEMADKRFLDVSAQCGLKSDEAFAKDKVSVDSFIYCLCTYEFRISLKKPGG